jgi:hypothetical protein
MTNAIIPETNDKSAARLLELIQMRLISEVIFVVASLGIPDLLAIGLRGFGTGGGRRSQPFTSPPGDACSVNLRHLFASKVKSGTNPLWLGVLLEKAIRPAVARADISKRIGWQ